MSIISLLVVKFYDKGASLRDIAWLFGISYPRAWYIINKYAPEKMRTPGSNRVIGTMRPNGESHEST